MQPSLQHVMYKGVVTDIFFDLDHTLWDFERNSALTFEKILAERQIDVDLVDFLQVYVPNNLIYWKRYREGQITKAELRYQRLKTVFDTLGYPVSDTTILELAEAYIAHLSNFDHLLPNAREILDYLRPGYRLHIITNGFAEIQRKKLHNTRISEYFDCVIDSESAGVKKPDPRIFHFALTSSEAVAEKSLMIGDNLEADILGARAAGLHALHFNAHSDPEHDFCPMIHELREIKTLL